MFSLSVSIDLELNQVLVTLVYVLCKEKLYKTFFLIFSDLLSRNENEQHS